MNLKFSWRCGLQEYLSLFLELLVFLLTKIPISDEPITGIVLFDSEPSFSSFKERLFQSVKGALDILFGLKVALYGLGFSDKGIYKNSLAATWQKYFGDVPKESWFAKLQSQGAIKVSTAAKRAIVAGKVAIDSMPDEMKSMVEDIVKNVLPDVRDWMPF